jgi:hypothetical protein
VTRGPGPGEAGTGGRIYRPVRPARLRSAQPLGLPACLPAQPAGASRLGFVCCSRVRTRSCMCQSVEVPIPSHSQAPACLRLTRCLRAQIHISQGGSYVTGPQANTSLCAGWAVSDRCRCCTPRSRTRSTAPHSLTTLWLGLPQQSDAAIEPTQIAFVPRSFVHSPLSGAVAVKSTHPLHA